MPLLRRRNRRGPRAERQKASIRSKLRALGVVVKRRTFPVVKGARTDDRKVLARVRGVENAPLTHVGDYHDTAAYGRAFRAMTGAAEQPGEQPEPASSPSKP